jgi:hypothetical protein
MRVQVHRSSGVDPGDAFRGIGELGPDLSYDRGSSLPALLRLRSSTSVCYRPAGLGPGRPFFVVARNQLVAGSSGRIPFVSPARYGRIRGSSWGIE